MGSTALCCTWTVSRRHGCLNVLKTYTLIFKINPVKENVGVHFVLSVE